MNQQIAAQQEQAVEKVLQISSICRHQIDSLTSRHDYEYLQRSIRDMKQLVSLSLQSTRCMMLADIAKSWCELLQHANFAQWPPLPAQYELDMYLSLAIASR